MPSRFARAKAKAKSKVTPVQSKPPVLTEASDSLPKGRWKTGDNPLMLSPSGKPPTPATLRNRVWKNHAWDPMWGPKNQERMRAGRPPIRFNPLKGKTETAIVNTDSLRIGWKGDHLDPFVLFDAEQDPS